jgi:hypothetical protein
MCAAIRASQNEIEIPEDLRALDGWDAYSTALDEELDAKKTYGSERIATISSTNGFQDDYLLLEGPRHFLRCRTIQTMKQGSLKSILTHT